jgi:CubicO group peptidase (beta-lactamase class C family)
MRIARTPLGLVFMLLLTACGGAGETGDTAARLDTLFDRLEEHRLFRGAALVSDGGEVVYETARGLASEEWGIPNTVGTRYLIASLSKQFAAVIVLQLAGEGYLLLDDPLAARLDGLPAAWSGEVTVRHLLDQTSGIPDYVGLPDYMEVTSKRRFTREEFLAFIVGDPFFAALRFAPGERWEYSNTNYFLLGVVAETAAGAPYEDMVEQRILIPLAMRDSGVFDSRRPVRGLAEGYELTYDEVVEHAAHSEFSPKSAPSGGLYSTVRDLLKWADALRDGSLLTPTMREVFTTPGHLIEGDLGYACGQWREFLDRPGGERVACFSHGGSIMGMSTWLLRVPDEDRCVVLLHNGGGAREIFLEQVALAAVDILEGGDGKLPPLDLLGPLAGTYLNHREALFDHYRLLKERHRDLYDFGPGQLSLLGRLLVERLGDRATAAAVFRLNVAEHPGSPLAHRDLGGLLLAAGEADSALVHLLRARALGPGPDDELEALIARARAAEPR